MKWWQRSSLPLLLAVLIAGGPWLTALPSPAQAEPLYAEPGNGDDAGDASKTGDGDGDRDGDAGSAVLTIMTGTHVAAGHAELRHSSQSPACQAVNKNIQGTWTAFGDLSSYARAKAAMLAALRELGPHERCLFGSTPAGYLYTFPIAMRSTSKCTKLLSRTLANRSYLRGKTGMAATLVVVPWFLLRPDLVTLEELASAAGVRLRVLVTTGHDVRSAAFMQEGCPRFATILAGKEIYQQRMLQVELSDLTYQLHQLSTAQVVINTCALPPAAATSSMPELRDLQLPPAIKRLKRDEFDDAALRCPHASSSALADTGASEAEAEAGAGAEAEADVSDLPRQLQAELQAEPEFKVGSEGQLQAEPEFKVGSEGQLENLETLEDPEAPEAPETELGATHVSSVLAMELFHGRYLKKTLFASPGSEQGPATLVFVAGVEGTGHHMFSTLGKQHTTRPLYDALSTYLCDAAWSDDGPAAARYAAARAGLVAEMRALGTQRNADGSRVFFLNTVYSEKAVNMYSYPWGGPRCFLKRFARVICNIDVLELAKMAEAAGVDFRVVVLRRPLGAAVVSSAINRDFGTIISQTRVVSQSWALLRAGLQTLDDRFFEAFNYDSLVRSPWLDLERLAGHLNVPMASALGTHFNTTLTNSYRQYGEGIKAEVWSTKVAPVQWEFIKDMLRDDL